MKIDLTLNEARVIQDALDATSLYCSGCYMGYKSGDEDLCFKLDKDGNYRCKLMREIDSINGKIEDAMDKGDKIWVLVDI